MGLLTLVKDSLRKAFTYASTYFSLVKKHAESLTNFLVEQAKARLGTRGQLGTEFDEVTHFDQPVVGGLVKNLQPLPTTPVQQIISLKQMPPVLPPQVGQNG